LDFGFRILDFGLKEIRKPQPFIKRNKKRATLLKKIARSD